MKKLIFYLLITTALYAQTVYQVVPNTKGNEIILSVVNESETLSAEKITVALSNLPRGIEVCSKLVEIDKLKKGEEREAVFLFDVKRIPETPKDTLRFLITDDKGGSWKKEIVIEYSLPKEFKLEQNYPNPFNPTTAIEFTIPQSGRYSIGVYNILGQLVRVLGDGEYQAGYYKVDFDASHFASGMYIYRLSGNNVNISKKMVLMK